MVGVTSPVRPRAKQVDAERATARRVALAKLFTPDQEALFERAKIQHEDEVLNHRLSWLTTSSAIFVTAYVLRFADGNTMPTVVHLGIPLLALCTCVSFHVGIWAATVASLDIEREWNKGHPEYRDALLGGTAATRIGGLWPARFVAPTFIVAWLAALLYEVKELFF
jgi:hypothetical protein